MTIKLAVIGCGAITRTSHIPTILQNPRFDLIALVDKDITLANRLLKEYGLDAHVSSNIEIPQIDAAIVATPPHLHAELSIALLKKGIHVLCEKPMATNTVEAEEMLKTAERQKRILLIGMQKHYCQNTDLMTEILNDGFIGKITSLKLTSAIRSQWDSGNVNRFNPKYSPGGVMFEHGIHWICRIIYWFGYPKLNKYADDRIDGVEANALVDCEFTSFGQRVIGSMYFSWDYGSTNKLTVYGSEGIAEIHDNHNSSVFVVKQISGKNKIIEISNSYKKEKEDLSSLQLEYFSDLITNNIWPVVQTQYAFEASRFIEECYGNRGSIYQPWVSYRLKENRM